MVHYKLTYFDGKGTGEIIRQVFALAGQEFEDVRIQFPDWPALKEKTPFGQIPVLEEDGKQLAQSYAIARYLSRKFGIAGKTTWEEAQVDALADQWKDFIQDIRPFIAAFFGFTQGDVEKLKKEHLLPGAKKHFPFFVNALNSSGSGFLVGQSATWVDLLVSGLIALFAFKVPEALEGFQELIDHHKKVHSIPQIAEYLKTVPETKF